MVAAPDNRDLSNKEEHTHIQHRNKKKKKKRMVHDGQIKKTAKRVTDSTLPCYGAIVGKHDSVWPFKVNPSRDSAYRTEKLMKKTLARIKHVKPALITSSAADNREP